MTANKWAVLIGIDFYMQGNARGDLELRNLSGCVNDVTAVDHFLQNELGLHTDRIHKLTASIPPHLSKNEPPEPKDEWPTYENMIACLRQVTKNAARGDLVYIHYSGHGAEVATNFDNLKGTTTKLDEALVPTNIALEGGRYLRDVEIAALLHEMVKEGLVVTVVLDCCHSGGLNRGSSLTARGISKPDCSVLKTDESMLPAEMLYAAFHAFPRGGLRAAATDDNWLLDPHGYALLAACRAPELAWERWYHDRVYGVLTYSLLEAFKNSKITQTYQMLYNRIRPAVYNQSLPITHRQTPVIGGETDRVFFSSARLQTMYATTVNEVCAAVAELGGTVQLNAGEAHGICRGAEFALYAVNSNDNPDDNSRLATVMVTQNIRGVTAEAELTSIVVGKDKEIQPGCRAMLLSNNSIQRRIVKFINNPALGQDVDQAGLFGEIKRVWNQKDRYFSLKPHNSQGEDRSDFQIKINTDNKFEVYGSGSSVRSNVVTSLDIHAADAYEKLLCQLTHLATYCNVRDIYNISYPSAGNLDVQLERLLKPPSQRKPRFASENDLINEPYLRWDKSEGIPEVRHGEWVLLRVKNLATVPVNITVLNLEPSWKIHQIYPQHSDSVTLRPSESLILPLQMIITQRDFELADFVDIIKVFATTEPTSFRWLKLPVLDKERETLRGPPPRNALEHLQTVMTLECPVRTAVPYCPDMEWTTEQVKIRTHQLGK